MGGRERFFFFCQRNIKEIYRMTGNPPGEGRGAFKAVGTVCAKPLW